MTYISEYTIQTIGSKWNKDKEKKRDIVDIKLTEEDIKISLLELKQRVGAPKIDFRRRK